MEELVFDRRQSKRLQCLGARRKGELHVKNRWKYDHVVGTRHTSDYDGCRQSGSDRSVGGGQSVIPLAQKHKAPVVAIVELADWFVSKGVGDARGMGKGGTQRIGDIEVTMVHADHTSSVEDDGRPVYVGEPAGLVVKLPGGLKLYHAGDTAVFGDMKIIGELYKPDVACLPIGGHYTMDPREA